MSKRLFFILFSLILSISVFAKDEPGPEFYKRWTNLPDETLIEMGREYILERMMPDSALVSFSIISNRYHEKMSKEEKLRCASAYNNAGYIYFYYYYDYTKSYSCLLKSLEIAEKEEAYAILSYVYLNLGNMYLTYNSQQYSGNLDKQGQEYYKLAFHEAVKARDWDVMMTIYINMVTQALSMSNIDDVKDEISIFRELAIPNNIPMLKYTQYMNDGIDHLKNKDYAQALEAFKKQLSAIEVTTTPERFVIQSYFNIIQVFTLQAKFDSVIDYIYKIDRLSEIHQMKDIQVSANKELYEQFSKAGDDERASFYKYRYLEKKDSLLNYHKLENVSEMRFLHELKKVDEQVKELDQKRQKQNIILSIVGIGAMVISIFLLVYYRQNKRLYKRNQSLYQKNLEILKSEEQERKQRKAFEHQLKSYKGRLDNPDLTENTQKVKYQNSILNEEDKTVLFNKIQDAMENTEEICSDDFSLERLSAMVDSKPKYVSQVINEMYQKNFSNLLSDYRIKEASKRLADIENYGHLTIESVSASVGFKSRSNFVVAFKRVIGLTPSEYQRIAKDSK